MLNYGCQHIDPDRSPADTEMVRIDQISESDFAPA